MVVLWIVSVVALVALLGAEVLSQWFGRGDMHWMWRVELRSEDGEDEPDDLYIVAPTLMKAMISAGVQVPGGCEMISIRRERKVNAVVAEQ